MINYIIVSPVRNEEKLIRTTIESVVNQTLIPNEWIIVNDGSTDNTQQIIEEYTKRYDWIRIHNIEDRGFYYPGTGVVNVVNTGLQQISQNGWEYLVKLDCDLSIESNYFENIFNEFIKNPKLGIASGAVFLQTPTKQIKEKSQPDHPWGASKIYKRECFDKIGGLKPIPGWDLNDLLSAQLKGWETRCFDEYKILHFRESGSRRKGFTGGKFLLGRFLFRYGYSFFFTFLKAIYRSAEKPYIIGGISLILGYIFALIKNEEKLFDKDVREFLRKKQRVYLKQKLFRK